MELFDDLLRHRDQKHGHHDGRYYDELHRDGRHRDDHFPSRHSYDGDDHHGSWNRHGAHSSHIPPHIQQLMRNKSVLVLLAILVVVILTLAVGAFIYLLPLILKMFGYVGENGIKGLIDQVMPIINQLWLGSGK